MPSKDPFCVCDSSLIDEGFKLIYEKSVLFTPVWISKLVEIYKDFDVSIDFFFFFLECFTRKDFFDVEGKDIFDLLDEDFFDRAPIIELR